MWSAQEKACAVDFLFVPFPHLDTLLRTAIIGWPAQRAGTLLQTYEV